MIKSIALGALLFACIYTIVLFTSKRRAAKLEASRPIKHLNDLAKRPPRQHK